MAVTPLPNFFLIPQAAEHAQVSVYTIRREISEGKLRARQVGHLIRILDEDLARWMRGEPPRPDPPNESPAALAHAPSLSSGSSF